MSLIRKTSMKDQVYEIVRDRIFNGEYAFGETISILGLSKELEISNTPIREALNMLASEGLLTNSLNNKFRVIEPGEKDMDELNEAVLVLLEGGCRIAYKKGLQKKLPDMLDDALASQKKALTENADREYINYTMMFDRCFVEVTGNQKLIDAYDNYSNLLYLYVVHTYWKEKSNLQKKLKEHEEIARAVKNESMEKVLDLLEQHYDEHYGKVL
jgi:DNA-binding GntR family transcriptional regulator